MYVLLPFTFPRIASPCTFDTHRLLLHYLPCTHSTSPQVICQYFPSSFFCFFQAKRPPFGWPHHNAAGRQASLTVLLYFFIIFSFYRPKKSGCCCSFTSPSCTALPHISSRSPEILLSLCTRSPRGKGASRSAAPCRTG